MDYERGGQQKESYTDSEIVFVDCPFCKERNVLSIVRCLNCSLIYVNPRLKNPEGVYWDDTDKYYQEAKLIFESKAKHHREWI